MFSKIFLTLSSLWKARHFQHGTFVLVSDIHPVNKFSKTLPRNSMNNRKAISSRRERPPGFQALRSILPNPFDIHKHLCLLKVPGSNSVDNEEKISVEKLSI